MAEINGIPEVKVRRFKLMLFQLDEKLKRTGDVLCQLSTFSTTFAINTIPMATVTPLLGTLINAVSGKIDYATIDNLAKDRAPVGVYAEITHGFSSKDNSSEQQYWPDTRAGEPDQFGEYKNSEYTCLFKGYLLPVTKEISAIDASFTIYIQHWLSAIAGLSLLSPRVHTGNSAELALAMYGVNANTHNKNLWLTGIVADFENISDIWENGIKVIFLAALDFLKNAGTKSIYNNPVQKLIDRMRLVITEKIKPDKESLVLDKNTASNLHTLSYCIGVALSEEMIQSFADQTAWGKLVTRYMPMFLFSIVPRVDDAILIPAPSIVDIDNCITITSDEILKVSAIDYPDSLMSEMICVSTEQDAGRTMGAPTFITQARYPEESKRPGVTHSVAFPSWINSAVPTAVTGHMDCWRIFEAPDKPLKESLEALEDETKKVDAKKSVADRFVKYSYLTQLLQSTSAKLTVPVRMDVCPGACIEVKAIGFDGTEIYVYGTVASISVSFTAAETACTAEISLVNIRNKEYASDEIDNPKKPVGFYDGVFTGTRDEDVLYVTEPI